MFPDQDIQTCGPGGRPSKAESKLWEKALWPMCPTPAPTTPAPTQVKTWSHDNDFGTCKGWCGSEYESFPMNKCNWGKCRGCAPCKTELGEAASVTRTNCLAHDIDCGPYASKCLWHQPTTPEQCTVPCRKAYAGVLSPIWRTGLKYEVPLIANDQWPESGIIQTQRFCDGQSAVLLCKSGSAIEIVSAVYGRPNIAEFAHGCGGKLPDDSKIVCEKPVTDQVEQMCTGKQKCDFNDGLAACPTTFGKSCQSPNGEPRSGYLVVTYKCAPYDATACKSCDSILKEHALSPSAWRAISSYAKFCFDAQSCRSPIFKEPQPVTRSSVAFHEVAPIIGRCSSALSWCKTSIYGKHCTAVAPVPLADKPVLCKCMPQACVRTYLRERKIANLCDSRLTQVVTTCTGHPDDDCNALTDRRDESFARLQNGSNVTLQYGRKENFQNLTIFWPPTALNDPKATKDEDAVTFNVECFYRINGIWWPHFVTVLFAILMCLCSGFHRCSNKDSKPEASWEDHHCVESLSSTVCSLAT